MLAPFTINTESYVENNQELGFGTLVIPELNPQLCWGEWEELRCSICDKKAPSVWWLSDHFGGRSDTEGATGEKEPITHGVGM
jgi:hypothetical protein